MTDPASTSTDGENTPPIKSGWRITRRWVLFSLLVVLVGVLAMRDDLRKSAADSAEIALRYITFDALGWSPREIFAWRLRAAGLANSPLGQRWRGAVARASEAPVHVTDQLRASEIFAEDQIDAHVYQLALERGEQLSWRLERAGPSESRLFASLEWREDTSQNWTTITELVADGADRSRVVSRSGDYRFVLQPELFARTAYSLTVAHGGSLPFPVEAASQRDIGSRFGAPRDGGARQHHGVDIFAKRGTAVKAVVDGRVRTGTSGIGGNHVWLSGGVLGFGGARYYYAHLDSFAIESGESVKRGDVLGYVGNTGNARTTPPHLHFGIYSGGPVNPAPFLKPQPVLPGE